MNIDSALDHGKANSDLFTFTDQLRSNCTAPEPDFLNWMDWWLLMDEGNTGDEAENVTLSEEYRAAWGLFHRAISATEDLLGLYKEKPKLFQAIAKKLNFLPTFLSRHPDNVRFNRDYLESSLLSASEGQSASQLKAPHMARQSWPVRYAYAIIFTIDLNLDTYETRLSEWAELYGYGTKRPIPAASYEAAMDRLGWEEERRKQERPKYFGHYRILPEWARGLASVSRPFHKRHVLDYWRVGKAMILEEMPDFHLLPEWEKYNARRDYQNGAKTGAVQHAIFKDILSALRTIAGVAERKKGPASQK